jgi:hypothetical protein
MLGLPFVVQADAQSSGGGLPQGGVAGSTLRNILDVPVGTILPVKINHGFSSKNARAGQTITGRIMQHVPLPGGGKIPEGAKVVGAVVSVTPAGSGGGARISLRFNELEIHRRQTAIVTDLRALASMVEVQEAEIPATPLDHGTSDAWATLRQIGGDMKYGVGGPVTDSSGQTVGKGVFDGVLVHVRALRRDEVPGSAGCGRPPTGVVGFFSGRLRSLWDEWSDDCACWPDGADGRDCAGGGERRDQSARRERNAAARYSGIGGQPGNSRREVLPM